MIRQKKNVIKKKAHLCTKCISLKNATVSNINNTTHAKKVIKEGIINLTGKELDKNEMRVLNVGPKFVLT